MGPIQTDFIQFKKCQLLNDRILIGIDCGYSLTKFIFLNKINVNELSDITCDHITLQYATFNKEDTESGLNWLKENAFIPLNTTMNIRGTGTNCILYKANIESIFGLKLEIIKENKSIIAGHRIAFEQIGVENMKYPSVELDNYGELINHVINKSVEGTIKRMTRTDGEIVKSICPDFPCLICLCGSMLTYVYYDENGKAEQIGGMVNGGETFLGLSKCLLDTNNYDEIIDLARKGNRCNVDSQFRDLLDEKIELHYSNYPLDLPILYFGKCGDNYKGLANVSKEDVAAGFVALYSSMISGNRIPMCVRSKLTKIYFSGNIFQSKLFQKEIKMFNILDWYAVKLEFIILNSGFCTALGAMLFCGEDVKYFKYPNQYTSFS